jgi:VanZ family protein
MKKHLWTILYAGWLAAVIVLSLVPSPPEISIGLLSWDKIQHAGAYGLMTILGGLGLCHFIRSGRCWPASAAIALLVGILLEGAQGLMNIGRSADLQDWAADAVGAASALFLVVFVRFYRSRSSGH